MGQWFPRFRYKYRPDMSPANRNITSDQTGSSNISNFPASSSKPCCSLMGTIPAIPGVIGLKLENCPFQFVITYESSGDRPVLPGSLPFRKLQFKPSHPTEGSKIISDRGKWTRSNSFRVPFSVVYSPFSSWRELTALSPSFE